MNILLWTLQALLAFWNLTGGFYMAGHYEDLTKGLASPLPKPLWIAHGVLQMLFALGLVLPAAGKMLPKAVPAAAIGLAVLMVLDAVLPLSAPYGGFPGMLWPLVPGALAAFVAYGRLKVKPL
jgi:peptidoglycan/LPS O-acetylase OafA/YrhL